MPPRRAATTFIFITIMLDILALGVTIPVLPKLVLSFLDGKTANAATLFGIFGMVFALMQFVFSPVLGVLSDHVGRRPVILISNLGLGLDYMVMALAPSLGWLFFGRVISGITAASYLTSMAYISDVTPPEKRAGAYGIMGAAFGIGFILGPALGGLLGDHNPRLPFWVAGGLSLANALYGFFVLPESLGPEQRKRFELRRANPLGSLRLLRSHPDLRELAVIQFLGYLAHEIFSIWALYSIFRYAWQAGTIGLSIAVVGVCTLVISGGLVRPLVARLGERRTLWIGQLFGGIGMVLAGLARTGTGYFLSIPVMMLWSLSGPSAQGLMSRRVGGSEQGELQGALGSLRAIATVIGPGLFSFTFAYVISPRHDWKWPGVPWYVAGGLLFAAMCLSLRMSTREPVAVAGTAA